MSEISAMVSLVYNDWQNAPSDVPDGFYKVMLELVETGRVCAALDDSTGQVVYWSTNTEG